MKYVRTKDGMYEVSIKDDEIERYIVKRRKDSIAYEDVIIESDRLEDLFDEQIVEYNKNGKTIRREFVNHIYDGKIPEGEPEYYGAIRTEMGLHYIAKEIEGKWRLI